MSVVLVSGLLASLLCAVVFVLFNVQARHGQEHVLGSTARRVAEPAHNNRLHSVIVTGSGEPAQVVNSNGQIVAATYQN